MKSALECLMKAAQCEHLATTTEDAANRTALLTGDAAAYFGRECERSAATVPERDPERQPFRAAS
jgi:hypothetical protein